MKSLRVLLGLQAALQNDMFGCGLSAQGLLKPGWPNPPAPLAPGGICRELDGPSLLTQGTSVGWLWPLQPQNLAAKIFERVR